MWFNVLLLVLATLAAASCDRPAVEPTERTYDLHGQVQSIDSARNLIVLKHDEIKGFMPAMTMPYEVQDAKALGGVAPGDLVDARLVVFSNGAHLRNIRKVGQAPLEKPSEPSAPAASSDLQLLKPGEAVPDARFVDQDGRKRYFADFKGSRLVMTFIYTRCPLATFCPLMDRHFAAMQRRLTEDPALQNTRLLTVSFDPVTDTPAVLREHAKKLKADLTRWTFLTGDRDVIDQFASRFGVSISRAPNDPRDITHNLRTAVVDADGTLVRIYTGNDWTPEQVLADLASVGVPAKHTGEQGPPE